MFQLFEECDGCAAVGIGAATIDDPMGIRSEDAIDIFTCCASSAEDEMNIAERMSEFYTVLFLPTALIRTKCTYQMVYLRTQGVEREQLKAQYTPEIKYVQQR